MSEKPELSAQFSIALVTACTLALQVVLSRLFSTVMAYHFSFLAVSLAMLGMGAGAFLIYLRPSWFDAGSTRAMLSRLCALFAGLLIVVPFLIVRLDFAQKEQLGVSFVVTLATACLLCTLPSLASGLTVSLAISRYRFSIGSVYFFDMVGAGLGALTVVPALYILDAPALLVCLGGIAALAAALFAGPLRTERKIAFVLFALAVGSLAVSRVSPVLLLPHYYNLPPDVIKVSERWTPLARVFGFRLPDNDRMALLFYDRVYAPVPLVRPGKIPNWKELFTGPGSVSFELTGPGRTLIIGGGGGRDIYTALSSGQKQIDVIELIDGNRKVVDEDLGAVSGSPYSRPGVSTVIGDGRSVLAGRKTLYDIIYISFTDSLSANAAAGYALMENNLYTVDAFTEYLTHLRPGGVLSVSRLIKLVGDEALRATVLALAAQERLGVADPKKHVVVVGGKDIFGELIGVVLSKREPFTASDLFLLRRLAEERGTGLLFAPGSPHSREWKELAESPDLKTFCNGWHLNVCPPTDDRPFFFSMQRLSRLGERLKGYHYSVNPDAILMLTLIILIFFSALAFLLPLATVKVGPRPSLTTIGFFAAIGLGYMLLEVVLIQRMVLFLGFPTYALSVVLFSLLLFSGVGSYLSRGWQREREMLLVVLIALIVLLGVAAFGALPLVHRLIHLGFAARVVIAIALISPIGLAAGTVMPLGLRRLSRLRPNTVAYAWGVNGICSVLASVLGVAIALHLGFNAATLAAATCYFGALLFVALNGRSTGN